MVDRSILQSAANAAGYTIRFHSGICKGGAYEGCERLWPDGEWRAWRPADDDADSFRLKCDVGLNVFHVAGSAYAIPPDDEGDAEEVRRPYASHGGVYGAARMAILIAAANEGASNA